MRHNRLKHAADTLCHMFAGWRLSNSYGELERLGSGSLLINTLTAECQMNGKPVGPLAIAQELQTWLLNDLKQHRIELSKIRAATLEAELRIERTVRRKKPARTVYIGKDQNPITKGEFVSLSANCQSRIASDDSEYTSHLQFEETWPVGWPIV